MRSGGKEDAIPLHALFKMPRLLRRGVSLIQRKTLGKRIRGHYVESVKRDALKNKFMAKVTLFEAPRSPALALL
jgi:hypothetical protein